jgi:hypothetical protein
MNSTTTNDNNNNGNLQQEDNGHQSVVAAVAVAAMATTQPIFCESLNTTNANRSGGIVRSPKRLTSLLSSPLFATNAPPGIVESRSRNIGIVQDNGGEALVLVVPQPVEEKNEEAKAKPARVDEVTMSDSIVHRKAFFEGPFQRDGDGDSSVIEDNGDDVDAEPHRKKQKKQLLCENEDKDEELQREAEYAHSEDDRFALAKAVRERDSVYNRGGDDAKVDQDNDDMLAVPMILLEDGDVDDVDNKIRKWSRELLALQKIISDGRVRTWISFLLSTIVGSK